MNKLKKENKSEFESIILLIEEARNRAFSKVNVELVLLYFNVGKIVSAKVDKGAWGEGTVDELAKYINVKMPGLSGFNRRGLYRMKQFYETYSDPEFVPSLATQLEEYFNANKEFSKVSALPTQLKKSKSKIKKVSAAGTQLTDIELLKDKFVTTVLTHISWANHLEILSGTKSSEEKFFYLIYCIKEKWTFRELRRQLSTGYFERTMLSNSIVSAVPAQIPQNLFKDPYIFEFLDLPDIHSETDLEKSLIKNLQKFIIEIGKGFAYMGNQFRLQVGNKDY